MSDYPKCPRCGTPLPSGAIQGLCPACLLQQGAAADSASQPSAPFEPPAVSEIARLFPQFEILALLGKGGMGAVYKARQPSLDRFVALKILAARADGSGFADRFTREAKALARLSHPAIVGVYEFGETGGLHYLIMEYVDGANLRQLEKAGRLSPREALQIVPQICDALQYAHDEGVVHRDIKPENILLDRKGRVKIADFGLAKILGLDADALRLTGEGHVMGTPHYMAPEQVEHPLEVDHRADIYSLGVVFYEMLTGELPLGKFSPPSRKVSVDVRLDEVVLRSLEKEPEMRYQHASEVKTRLDTIRETSAPAPADGGSAPAGKPRWGMLAVIWCAIFIPATIAVMANGWAPKALWVGIGVSLVALVAAIITGLARRAAKAPLSALAVIGTVFALLVVGVIALIALALIIPMISMHHAPPNPKPVAPPQTSASANSLEASQVDLVAVSENASSSKTWWKADGSPAETVLLDDADAHLHLKSGQQARTFVFHTGGPITAGTLYCRFDPPAADWGSTAVLRNKQEVPGLEIFTAVFPDTVRTVSVEAGVAPGSWETIVEADPGAGLHSKTDSLGREWSVLLREPIHTARGNNVITAVVNTNIKAMAGIAALDSTGAPIMPTDVEGSNSTTMVDPMMQWAARFGGSNDLVAKIRVRVLPYIWTRIPSVALNPAAPSPADSTPEAAKP